MKRTFAVVALLASLGVLIKLATKPIGPDRDADAPVDGDRPRRSAGMPRHPLRPGPIRARVPCWRKYRTASPQVREMVARLAERFGRNAEAIDRTDGERGLVLLDRLDMEAIFLYEKYPAEFHRLRDVLGADAAADVLLHWREYFGLKRADETDRGILIAEIAGLTPSQRRVAARYPGRAAADPGGPAGRDRLDRANGGTTEAALGEMPWRS